MVYQQGTTWYRSDRTTPFFHPWVQSGLGNGGEPHVVHQQHGHASHVSTPPSSSASPSHFDNGTSTHPTLRLGQGRPLPHSGHSLSHVPWYLLSCLIGILVNSSSQAIYGVTIWSQIELFGRFLDDNPSPAMRFWVSLHLLYSLAQWGSSLE